MGDNYDPFLSDYYSLGMMALELATFEDMTFVYEKGFRRIKQDCIVKEINKVKD